jgi:hypothetical protein
MNPEIFDLFDEDDRAWGCVESFSACDERMKDILDAIPIVSGVLGTFSMRTAIVKQLNYKNIKSNQFFVDRDVRHENILCILHQLLVCLRSQGPELAVSKV